MSTIASSNLPPRTRQRWQPSPKDHLIFEWVKMDGQSQTWVATQMGISQATVSRVVQRYERWQAHAQPREGGRLDHTERLRAQRWLTYQRNEVILASCLRIAREVEGLAETKWRKIEQPLRHDPSCSQDIRTERAETDRTGTAARFLRLAFRINMEQLKLAELNEPPIPEPLTDDILNEEERQLAEELQDQLDYERARAAAGLPPQPSAPEPTECATPTTAPQTDTISTSAEVPAVDNETAKNQVGTAHPATTSDHSPTHHSPAALNNLNNLHKNESAEIDTTPAIPCTCEPSTRAKKKPPATCITNRDQQAWDRGNEPKPTKSRGRAAVKPK
jgi:hypothetical protein